MEEEVRRSLRTLFADRGITFPDGWRNGTRQRKRPKMIAQKAAPKLDAERRAVRNRAIVAEYLAGGTLRGVGKAYGISGERVRQILVKAGVDERNTYAPRVDAELARRNEEMAALRRSGWTYPDLAERYRLSRVAVTSICRSLGCRGYRLRPCGTNAAYARGCRCESCRQAYRTYFSELCKRLYRERVATGRCSNIGCPRAPRHGRKTCAACAEKMAGYHAAYAARRRTACARPARRA